MPLHDWTDRPGWDGVHHVWITELFRWIKPRLPSGYRAYIGTAPMVAIGAPPQHPDVHVRKWEEPVTPAATETQQVSEEVKDEPDIEVALASIDPGTAVYVERQGLLVAAVELVSPRNKDRPSARATYVERYVGYLLQGIHLLLVDLHRRPLNFSFADRIAEELQFTAHQPLPVPLAVSYRVGEPAATGGHLLAVWRRPLTVGDQLPTIPLALSVEAKVTIDLEQTYSRAASDMYL
jgi:hypothetical protein